MLRKIEMRNEWKAIDIRNLMRNLLYTLIDGTAWIIGLSLLIASIGALGWVFDHIDYYTIMPWVWLVLVGMAAVAVLVTAALHIRPVLVYGGGLLLAWLVLNTIDAMSEHDLLATVVVLMLALIFGGGALLISIPKDIEERAERGRRERAAAAVEREWAVRERREWEWELEKCADIEIDLRREFEPGYDEFEELKRLVDRR